MIKINKTDNIFDIISNIKKIEKNKKKIILIFPFWHNVLYNKIALQSLKNSFPESKIIVSTTDVLSKKIWKQVWLKYSIIKDDKFIEWKDILKYNYSFLEYLNYEIKKFFNSIINLFLKNKKDIDPRKKFLKYYKQKTNLNLLLLILIISILIFSYVFIFALNKTYVYITPDIQVKSKSQNFIFKQNFNESTLNKNYIELKPFTKEIILQEKIFTSWILQKERYRSTWKVVLINKYETEIKLLGKTRLKSQEWIIYEIKTWVDIPKAIKNKAWTLIPWTKEVEIIAQLRDDNWNITWSRWNISKDILLILPWLETEDRKNIFAKTTTAIKSWEDIFEKVLGKKDLINAEKIFTENLKKEAIKQIQKDIELQNKENNVKYQILNIDDIYELYNMTVSIPEIKVWEKIDFFNVSWKIEVKTYAFNIDSVISKLKKTIESTILIGKEKLLYINDRSISIFPKIWVLYKSQNPLTIKATVEVDYNIEYNFSKENNNYTKRLKQLISTMDISKAEKTLINESKISNAKIEVRPFFVNKVSKYLNNIEFIIEK